VFVALALTMAIGLTVAQGAQEVWYSVYEQAERAFERDDYPLAEQLFLKSMRSPLAPTARGVNVLRYSQVRGVIPEYYLAIIAAKAGRLDEAYGYAQTATGKDYFRSGDSRLEAMADIVDAWIAANPSATVRGGLRVLPMPITPEVVGPFYALVIGIDNYIEQPKLMTAVADGNAVAELLQRDYGFQVRLLLDATREQISRAFNEYRRTLRERDNLLIYYAGHGHLDKKADQVWWLPVNAERDDTTNWIIAEDITAMIQQIQARHVLLVADSCYAAGITRDAYLARAKVDRDNYHRRMIQNPSRTLLSSGGVEPVADGGGDGHSVFARAFLLHLGRAREDPAFTADTLYHDVRQSVGGRSDQTPMYAQIRKASRDVEEVGDFVFLRQRAPGK
jgi:hypothetical protein